MNEKSVDKGERILDSNPKFKRYSITICDYKEIKDILKGRKYRNLTEREIEDITPTTLNRIELQNFYEETALTVFHYIYDSENERCVFFNRCGAFPDYDYGSGNYIQASGEYAKADGDIGLKFDIAIEEYVELITITKDLKNYVIIPKDEKIPKGDPTDIKNKNFHKFYVPIEV